MPAQCDGRHVVCSVEGGTGWHAGLVLDVLLPKEADQLELLLLNAVLEEPERHHRKPQLRSSAMYIIMH